MTDAANAGRDGTGEAAVDHLLCEHRWVRPGEEGQHPVCASCGLGYAEYVQGEVRAALSRMDAWP